MTTINMITKLYQPGGVVDESTIQAHFDTQNADGYYLVFVENMSGWYRFYWAKEQ